MPLVPTFPMVNKGNLYSMQCLLLNGPTNVELTIGSGHMRDHTNTNDIIFPQALDVNSAIQGAGGMDQGALAATTFYAVYVIGSSNDGDPNSADYVPSAGLISANLTTPVLPTNYDMYRRIGFVKTDGAAHFLPFQQTGTDVQRIMWYDTPIQILNAGASAVYAAVDASAALPNNATYLGFPDGGAAILNFSYTPTAGGNLANLKRDGSASTRGNVEISGAVAGVLQEVQVTCPCSFVATTAFEYKCVGTLTLDVTGYYDDLNAGL